MIRSFAASALVLALAAAGLAHAQPGPAKRPGPTGRVPCGAPLTGQAPDVMTYDRASGTQVFVSGQGGTEVSAFNQRTGSSAGLSGDLSRPGVTEACASDALTGDGYAVTSRGPGDIAVVGRDGQTGERWAIKRSDGTTEYWDPRGEHRCFRGSLGVFPGARGC
ncbi:hypothetical protein CFHF_22400 [Caulobacter flavus]|uniref:Secreted protein n=1 Tax=Caulobacter flavus TaxID=1679497 RepID=A0A2N5CMM9_9CAUL|nr:hypothetical protein [Caulobacter flavus]AYV47095.1 hypothetical protein C1707_12950 [Caulobacter flavus]PLR07387.1 hypothetical protein CFHF_22400 [Caulobacter flavus]